MLDFGMNILIVDDNMTNRIVVKALLENYEEQNSVRFALEEATDGLEAVEICAKKEFDIVLMDINMPNMNGIEASKIIRQNHPKLMIIAISTNDDDEQRRAILNNGAEDYISKPIDPDIFKRRMKNYLALVESRKSKVIETSRFVNLFSNEIYNRHTCFILDSEDALAEFWEFFLLKARAKSNYLSDVIRVIVALVEKQMQLSAINKLYIEESEDIQYFTLTGIDVLPIKVVELILKKNEMKEGFKLSASKISFELIKAKQYEDETVHKPIKPAKAKQVEIIKTVQVEPLTMKASAPLVVFDYLDSDDMIDLEEYAGKLNSLMLLVGSDLNEEEVVEIYSFVDRLASILHTYAEAVDISEALASLSRDMRDHMAVFLENANSFAPMCSAFSKDMSNWVEQTFYTGAPSVDFMNATIVVNCQTISGMLTMNDTPADGEDDFDDIFDF